MFCKSAYFIEKKNDPLFLAGKRGRNNNLLLRRGGIVFSMDELYYNKPSEEFVETLEDVVAYRISLDRFITAV